MSQNIGTLITSTLRPNDSLDPIAIIFANEAKGGHHSYLTYDDMLTFQTTYPDRLDFGMLVTIYGDPTASNNNTYILQYSYSSTTLTDPNNWILYNSANSNNINEWQNSVISRTNSIPLINSNNDRYLITGLIAGTSTILNENTWSGHVDNITTYDSRIPTWNFTLPNEGMSVRVDNEQGVIYKYNGIYASGGYWVKEYTNQVYSITASSNDGINYTAYADLLTSYNKPSVFYTSFLTSSVGTSATLNINNIGTASIEKVNGSSLQAIGAGDLNTTLVYQLIWDGTQFQVPFNSAVTTIGNPELNSPTYSNGVYNYPDFTVNTPIGTAVDRFNRLLFYLLPQPSPDLFTQSMLTSGVIAKSSFPSSIVSNFNNNSTYGVAGLDGTFSLSNFRLGVFAATTSNDRNKDIVGILNYNVNSTTSYGTASFNNEGYLYLIVNGLTVSTATLSNISDIDTTNGLTTPGFLLGSATASKFPNGGPFENYFGRTGSFCIPKDSYLGPYSYSPSIGLTANAFGFTRGYNNISIKQDTTTSIINLDTVEFILDDNPTAISLSSGSINNVTFGPTAALSGIVYYRSVSLNYSCTIANAYINVYSNLSNAISITDNSSGSGTPSTSLSETSPIPTLAANPSGTFTYQTNTFNFTSNVRRVGDTIGCYVSNILKPSLNTGSQSFTTGTGEFKSLTGLYLDTFINNVGSDEQELFLNESKRLRETGVPFDTISSIGSNPYNSNNSLRTTNITELQVINGNLVYPSVDFSSVGGLLNGSSYNTSNLNFGVSNRDYSSCTGIRYFLRYFRFDTTLYPNNYKFRLTFGPNGSGSITASNVNLASLSGTNNLKVEVKLPGASNKITGWLDTASPFTLTSTNPLVDGTGCLDTSQIPIVSGSYDIQIGWPDTNISSSRSNGNLLMRISAPQGWTGNIDSIIVTPL